jgi:hypothetical protein
VQPTKHDSTPITHPQRAASFCLYLVHGPELLRWQQLLTLWRRKCCLQSPSLNKLCGSVLLKTPLLDPLPRFVAKLCSSHPKATSINQQANNKQQTLHIMSTTQESARDAAVNVKGAVDEVSFGSISFVRPLRLSWLVCSILRHLTLSVADVCRVVLIFGSKLQSI